jgi:hypothetical protein
MTEPNYPVPDRAPEGNRRIAVHDEIEAAAFARVATASATSPVVAALLAYAEVEATALIRANIQIVHALVEALIEAGSQSGDEVDGIVARKVSTQALAIERANRNDWRRRVKSAASFATDY